MYRGLITVTLILVLSGLLIFTTGCASSPAELQDNPTTEILRLKITKVRNAVDETRATIADSRGAPYLPELYLRLGELLSEEARYHYLLAYEREQKRTRALHVPQVRLLKEDAIATYELVEQRFGDSPLVPRVLFNMGHEHRELGNFDDMRQVLTRLVEQHPKSPLRYDALLVLGDYHFDRAELDESKQYYDEIAKGSLQRVSGLGHYKVAWVHVNQGNCKSALFHFERAIQRSGEWESWVEEIGQEAERLERTGLAESEIDVRREALVDLAYCYSRQRKAEDSLAYLRKRAYNRATYVAALDKLARRYRTMNKPAGTILLSRELLRLRPAGDDRLDDARSLHAALKRTKSFRYVGDDAHLIAAAFDQRIQRIDQRSEGRQKLREELEVLVRDLATSGQERLGKLGGVALVDTRAQVIEAYRVHATTFPNAESTPDVLMNLHEVLTDAGLYLEAGQRARDAAELLEGDRRKQALYDAVVAFQSSVAEQTNRTRYERVTARAALRSAGGLLLRYEIPREKRRRVEFAIAQTYYDAGDYFQAIHKLTAVAYAHPSSEEGDAAIQLVLDSYKTVNDYDGLMLASDRFLAKGSPASKPLRGKLKTILAAAEQRKLDEATLATAGEDGDLAPLLELAERYEGSEFAERALINAFVAARSVGDTAKMYELADQLAAKYPKSEQLPGIFTSLAQMAVARFDFDAGIEFLQKAAHADPDQRVQMLLTAGELLEQLGDYPAARKAYEDAAKSSEGAERGAAVARLADLLERTSDGKALLNTLRSFDGVAEPEFRVRLGLAQVAMGQPDEAESNLQAVFQSADATPEARARAHYGMAEVLLATLDRYPLPDSGDLIQEFITLVEVTQQSYLNAARQGSPVYTAISLSRLAHALRFAADKLGRSKIPADLPDDQQKLIRKALEGRVAALEASADDALDACRNQAWRSYVYNPVVSRCMADEPYPRTLIDYPQMQRRGASKSGGAQMEALRQRLSKNSQDIDGLRELGARLLKAGDAHAARLVFARAVQVEGSAELYNLLGVASFQIGDVAGAFEGFARAADAGLEAGRNNLATLLEAEGLAEQAKQVFEQFPEGRGEGMLLSAVR